MNFTLIKKKLSDESDDKKNSNLKLMIAKIQKKMLNIDNLVEILEFYKYDKYRIEAIEIFIEYINFWRRFKYLRRIYL